MSRRYLKACRIETHIIYTFIDTYESYAGNELILNTFSNCLFQGNIPGIFHKNVFEPVKEEDMGKENEPSSIEDGSISVVEDSIEMEDEFTSERCRNLVMSHTHSTSLKGSRLLRQEKRNTASWKSSKSNIRVMLSKFVRGGKREE